jgi:hypothetical protein
MCLFSLPVRAVAEIRLFARSGEGGRQFLGYDLRVDAPESCALLLPLPVPPKTLPEDVSFLDFSKYPQFFADLESGFPAPPVKPKPPGSNDPPDVLNSRDLELTDFEAQYLPTASHLERLDAAYRPPPEVLLQLPQYADFGFAVIRIRRGRQQLRPVMLDFPRRDPRHLFFPTLQVLDGRYRDSVRFDHALYAQPSNRDDSAVVKWYESRQPADFFVRTAKVQGAVAPDSHVHVRRLVGPQKNVDIVV